MHNNLIVQLASLPFIPPQVGVALSAFNLAQLYLSGCRDEHRLKQEWLQFGSSLLASGTLGLVGKLGSRALSGKRAEVLRKVLVETDEYKRLQSLVGEVKSVDEWRLALQKFEDRAVEILTNQQNKHLKKIMQDEIAVSKALEDIRIQLIREIELKAPKNLKEQMKHEANKTFKNIREKTRKPRKKRRDNESREKKLSRRGRGVSNSERRSLKDDGQQSKLYLACSTPSSGRTESVFGERSQEARSCNLTQRPNREKHDKRRSFLVRNLYGRNSNSISAGEPCILSNNQEGPVQTAFGEVS
ncbi:MAG: hypothetical protein NZO16_00755 [Deltaproteobacteria bacterium]|nr:hypothetical protein [Deltaproteobacteria bacterium]